MILLLTYLTGSLLNGDCFGGKITHCLLQICNSFEESEGPVDNGSIEYVVGV